MSKVALSEPLDEPIQSIVLGIQSPRPGQRLLVSVTGEITVTITSKDNTITQFLGVVRRPGEAGKDLPNNFPATIAAPYFALMQEGTSDTWKGTVAIADLPPTSPRTNNR